MLAMCFFPYLRTRRKVEVMSTSVLRGLEVPAPATPSTHSNTVPKLPRFRHTETRGAG